MLDARGSGVPLVAHWGEDLGDLDRAALADLADAQSPAEPPSSIDDPLRLSLIPLASEGWSGRQGVAGFRDSGPSSIAFRLDGIERAGASAVTVRTDDAASGLALSCEIGFDETGVLESRATVTNTGDSVWTLAKLGICLPLPARASELLDFTGRWSAERRPQRREIGHGSWTRETRHGRPGHDNPLLLAAGTAGFGFRSGEVWAVHLGWSGNHDLSAESSPTGHALLGAGELLEPGEIWLEPGASYESPTVFAAWSGQGLDGISQRFHSLLRARRPLPPRPVILNVWEAVYFDHDLERLTGLADLAASVGVERFVLDDGWMTGRTDDLSALGDWTVDPVRWPEGLHPLIRRVRENGMDFGLWIEPEMVSLDSALAREHPDWVLRGRPDRLPVSWRHQHVVDLDNPAAFAHILGRLSALLDEYPIAYLKWDHNRDLLGGSVHRQTRATYRLMDEVRRRHPALEIESCSSGGGRVDLGVLERTDRVWASDTNDPLERQAIQRWTSLVLPPEMIGSHLGAGVAHTTGRSSDLGFRLATALFWSAGIEWDLAKVSPAELAAVRTWISVYKSLRAMLHSGAVVRADAADPAVEVHGVVASDHAVFAVVCLAAPRDAVFSAVFPGLDPDARYRVEPIELGAGPHSVQVRPPRWLAAGGVTMTGRALGAVGLAMPALAPQQALVLRFTLV